MLWVKTRQQTSLDFGRAITPPLTQPYPIRLNPRGWTDFALPFKFDVLIGDVLASTEASGQRADSLQWYRWTPNEKKMYFPDPIAIPGFHAINQFHGGASYEIISKETTAYVLYNPLPDTITLLIPPVPVPLSIFSTRGMNKKAAAAGGWTLRISGRTSDLATLGPVYCGFTEGKPGVSYFSAPPRLGASALRVCDEHGQLSGHALVHGDLDRGGTAFDLAFVNYGGAPETMEYAVEPIGQLPVGFKIMTVDPRTGRCESTQNSLTVTVDAENSAHRRIAVGDKEYLANYTRTFAAWRFGLLGVFPNPFGSRIRIRYSLPEKGLRAMHLSIVSVFGRVVFEKTFLGAMESGIHETVWDATDKGHQPVGTGMLHRSLDRS